MADCTQLPMDRASIRPLPLGYITWSSFQYGCYGLFELNLFLWMCGLLRKEMQQKHLQNAIAKGKHSCYCSLWWTLTLGRRSLNSKSLRSQNDPVHSIYTVRQKRAFRNAEFAVPACRPVSFDSDGDQLGGVSAQFRGQNKGSIFVFLLGELCIALSEAQSHTLYWIIPFVTVLSILFYRYC